MSIVAVVGTRTFSDYKLLKKTLTGFDIKEIVSGGCSGADTMAERYAHHYGISLRVFPADWKKHGKAAGPIRNSLIAQYCDFVVAFWDGESPGTKDIIKKAGNLNKEIIVIPIS